MLEKLNKKERTKLLNRQLTSYFRERILDGRLPAGTRLPTDNELADEYHLSRDTVRQALALLADENLIERVQGRGTFVCQPPATSSPTPLIQEQKQIGLLLNRDTCSQQYMDIMIGLEQAVKLHGYTISLSYTDGDQEQQARDIARMQTNRLAGLIIYPVSNTVYTEAILQLQAANFPIVFIDRYLSHLSTDYVGVDNRSGGYRATEHLIILGHRRIGFIHIHLETPDNTSSVRERLQGYREALQKYGVPYDPSLVVSDLALVHNNTQQSLASFLQRPDRPTAIFAVNDALALDIMQVAHTLHLRIPQDLALVGFDDLHFSARVNPPLTTIAQSFFDIGLRAGTLLISRIEGITGAPKHIELPAHLIIRESCGAQLYVQRASMTPLPETPVF